MCLSSPKIPNPAPPAAAPTFDEARNNMLVRERRRKAATSGTQSTYLTGSQGAAPPFGQKTLMGQ